MSNLLIWIVTVLYAGQCAISAYNGDYYPAMILAGYTIANVGLILTLMG